MTGEVDEGEVDEEHFEEEEVGPHEDTESDCEYVASLICSTPKLQRIQSHAL